MKLENFKNLNIEARDKKGREIMGKDLDAIQELIDKQGNIAEMSEEGRVQLRKLRMIQSNEMMPEGFFFDFSLNILSMQGTWNFHNRRFGKPFKDPIEDHLHRVREVSLEKVLKDAIKRRK